MMEWLGIVIGNRHLRCGWFQHHQLHKVEIFTHKQLGNLPPWNGTVAIASVVPALTAQLQSIYPQARLITLKDIPLRGMYPSLGIDRALGGWGAINLFTSGALVIDCGTAIALTAVAQGYHFVGGAIMAGLGLQLSTLAEATGLLPAITIDQMTSNPVFWARSTPEAMVSGVFHSIQAGLAQFSRVWRQHYPTGMVVLTGGDGHLFHAYLPDSVYEPHLVLRGLANCTAVVAPPPAV